MKRSLTTRFLMSAMFIAIGTLAANAQQCDPDAENDLYSKFMTEYQNTPERQRSAAVTAREYLSKFGECTTDAEKKITAYIKNWLAGYEIAVVERPCTDAVDKTPAQAFEQCRPYVARDPESLRAYLLLSLAGMKQSSAADKKLKDETAKAARKA